MKAARRKVLAVRRPWNMASPGEADLLRLSSQVFTVTLLGTCSNVAPDPDINSGAKASA